MPRTLSFQAAVESPSGTGATSFLRIPSEVVAALGKGKRPPVVVTLGPRGYAFRTTVAVYGAESMVPVRREGREAAEIKFGEPLEVAIALDDAPRTVDLPQDLAQALDTADDGRMRACFEALAYTHRKEYVEWIVGAMRAETRQRRVAQALQMLRDGRKTPKA